MAKNLVSNFVRGAAVAAVLVFAGTVRPAFADNINVGDIVTVTTNLNYLGVPLGESTISGAVFSMHDVSTGADILSFCLQRTQFIAEGEQFRVGGIGNIVDDDVPEPLAQETAWIYDSFRRGALGFMPSTGPAVNAIQYAIWFFQNEDLSGFSAGEILDGTNLINAAIAATGGGWVNGVDGLVQVVNLFDGETGQLKKQDQLTWRVVQVPEPGSMVLLGAGLLAVARASRRRRVSQPVA